jgi:hypothetical protein
MRILSRNPVLSLLALLLLGLLATTAPATTAPATAAPARSTVTPQPRAHAHNDYEHERPLLDALDHGFTSVEADVWLVDGELRVAHDLAATKPGRTLESLYLGPLSHRVSANAGRVYPGYRGTFQLLIDVKSEADPTYAAVDRALRDHPGLMTSFVGGRSHQHAVTAVISGNRDLALMKAQKQRYAGYDGRLADLGSGESSTVMPLVSDNWSKTFTWRGVGPMPADEHDRLHAIVGTAHAHGYRVRFWETPDVAGPAREAVWTELVHADVDQINTDDLPGLQAFLAQHG